MNRCSVAILTAGLLSGCARFESQPISPAETAAQLDARRLDDAMLKKFLETHLGRELEVWPMKSWDLKALTLAAFFFNPSLDVARAQLGVAQAGVRTAGGRPNPTLNLVPGYDFSAAGGLSPWIPFFSVDVPVETAGKRRLRIVRAQHLSESALLNIASVAWQVHSRVRAALLDFTSANRRAERLEKQLAAQEKIVRLLEQRLAVGAISQSELTTARIAVNKTRLDLGEARSRRAEGRARLAEALGVSANVLEDLTLSLDPATPQAEDLADVRRIALRGRWDVLAELADYAAAQAALQLEIARQYPDVHLSPGYQFDQGDNKWTLGVTVELPLVNQNQGPIAEARARREEAAARFSELQTKVIGEIDRAVAAYRGAREQLNTSAALVAAAQKQRQSVAAQLEAGAADQLDLLNVEFEVGVATLAELDGQTKLRQSLGALEDALQQPIDSTQATSSASSLFDTVQRTPQRSTQSANSNQPGALK